MDKTGKVQLKLQQTVEGVSIIIFSYYMTSLYSYLLKVLGKKGFLSDHLLFTVCFIPVAFLVAFSITQRAKNKILKDGPED
jgi:uncharacterized membrane-anchored protein